MHHLQEMAAAGFAGVQVAVVHRGITEQRLGNSPCFFITADHVAGTITGTLHSTRGAGIQEVYPRLFKLIMAADGFLIVRIPGLNDNVPFGQQRGQLSDYRIDKRMRHHNPGNPRSVQLAHQFRQACRPCRALSSDLFNGSGIHIIRHNLMSML
ncbi:hypothetical protein D3C80_1309410 [compost metagenome]